MRDIWKKKKNGIFQGEREKKEEKKPKEMNINRKEKYNNKKKKDSYLASKSALLQSLSYYTCLRVQTSIALPTPLSLTPSI